MMVLSLRKSAIFAVRKSEWPEWPEWPLYPKKLKAGGRISVTLRHPHDSNQGSVSGKCFFWTFTMVILKLDDFGKGRFFPTKILVTS